MCGLAITTQFPRSSFVISILDLPFAVSPVVAGLMIVLLYGRNGWFGPFLEQANIKIIFALPGMVLATAFVTMPFVAREVIPVLEEAGFEQEEAARTLEQMTGKFSGVLPCLIFVGSALWLDFDQR
jgi:sulfate transport system permease protein